MTTRNSRSAALEAGRAAFRDGAWARAYDQLSAADEAAQLDVDDVERLATAAYLVGKDDRGIELWARAHAGFMHGHDVPRAARCIFWLVLDLLNRGELAHANGWLARGHRLLDESGVDCAERGLFLVLTARTHNMQRDPVAAADAALQAVEINRRYPDPDLAVFSRLALAQVRARCGDVSAAAALFDEIMVAVTVGEVSPIAVGVVYCAVIDSCHYVFDIARACEWTAALSRWCATQPDVVPFRGQCLVHRVEVMRLRGAWSGALDEAEQACTWLARSMAELEESGAGAITPFKYPVGAALYQQAEICRLRGDFGRAEALYRQASEHGKAPEPGLALLRLAQGRLAAAETAIRRILGESQDRFTRIEVLNAGVEIMLAARDLSTARAALEELTACAVALDQPFLHAVCEGAAGEMLLAEGVAQPALAALRRAWIAWQEIGAPYEAARIRVLIGRACRHLGDGAAAELEFDAARSVFERLAAAPDRARVDALRKEGAGAAGGLLTPRESQVIALIAAGKTNRGIAERLGISERTVDRHVSNILMKLKLSSRSAATAYAYEHRLV